MTATGPDAGGTRPDLTLAGSADTSDALYLWSHVGDEARLALEPIVDHGCQIPVHMSALEASG